MQPHHTVGFIKMMLVVKGEAVQTSELSMTFAGRQWDDSKTMSECNITNFNNITVNRKLRGGGTGKVTKKDKNIKDEKLLLLKAKLDNKKIMLGNDTIFDRVKYAVSTLNDTMGAAFKTELKGMNLEKCQMVSDTFYETSGVAERFMREMAPTFIPLLTELDTHINDLTNAKAMLVIAFELSYTSEFFNNGKFQHSEFEVLVQERLDECLKEAEVERRVAERMASASASMDM